MSRSRSDHTPQPSEPAGPADQTSSGMTRRQAVQQLLAGAAGAGALAALAGCSRPAAESPPLEQLPSPASGQAYLSVARGPDPATLVQAALKSLGGIERFVRPGHDVIVKPNMCSGYHGPKLAVNTNPEVVAAIVKLCLGAGARRVRVMDKPLGSTPEAAYARSGIGEAVGQAGGEMHTMAPMKYRDAAIPHGRDLHAWPMYGDVLDADVLINVPIAKHHTLAGLTLGMKNLMGVILERQKFHRNLSQRLADMCTVLRPTLTVVDAVRILVDNGPTGGSLDDVKETNTVIASHDLIAADAYAATLFGVPAGDLPAIRAAAEMGVGTLDLGNVKVEEVGT